MVVLAARAAGAAGAEALPLDLADVAHTAVLLAFGEGRWLGSLEREQHGGNWFAKLSEQHHGDVIFVLCLVIYMLIMLLWTMYWFMTRGSSSSRGKFYILLVSISWGMTSVCMHILNKVVVERTRAPATIALLQMGIAVVIMVPLSIYDLFQVSLKQMGIWLIVPLFYGGAVCTSSFTYEYISLSLLAIVRNLTPLVVMPIERMLMAEARAPKINLAACLSLLIMVVGAVLYVGGLHGFSWKGIAYAVVNVLLAVTDRFIQRRLLIEECKDLPTKVCTLVNNAVGILPCLIVSSVTHELRKTREFNSAAWTNPHNIFLILLSGIAGLGICYLGFECQRVISVTSFYVMQNVSRVFLVVVGVTLFQDPLRSPGPVAGLLLSLVGSCVYGNVQLQASQAAASRERQKASLTEEAAEAVSQNHEAKK